MRSLNVARMSVNQLAARMDCSTAWVWSLLRQGTPGLSRDEGPRQPGDLPRHRYVIVTDEFLRSKVPSEDGEVAALRQIVEMLKTQLVAAGLREDRLWDLLSKLQEPKTSKR